LTDHRCIESSATTVPVRAPSRKPDGSRCSRRARVRTKSDFSQTSTKAQLRPQIQSLIVAFGLLQRRRIHLMILVGNCNQAEGLVCVGCTNSAFMAFILPTRVCLRSCGARPTVIRSILRRLTRWRKSMEYLNCLRRFVSEDEGQDLIEYALLVGLISLI